MRALSPCRYTKRSFAGIASIVTGKYGGLIWSRMDLSMDGKGAGKDHPVAFHPGGAEKGDALEVVPVKVGEEDGKDPRAGPAASRVEMPRSRRPVPPSKMMMRPSSVRTSRQVGVSSDGAEDVGGTGPRGRARATGRSPGPRGGSAGPPRRSCRAPGRR